MTTMAATGAPVFRGPNVPPAKRNAMVPLTESDDDPYWAPTPVPMMGTAPALRAAIQQFAEALDPLQDEDLIEVVLSADGQTVIVFAHASLSAPHIVVRVGEEPLDSESITVGTAEALAVFSRVRAELGITQKDMFAATGIKHRTYHSWKKLGPTAQPRLASVGGLWHLADALEDIREALSGRSVAAWLHAAPERILALKAGRFDELLDLALDVTRRSGKSMGTSERTGVAADVDIPIVKTAKPNAMTVERGLNR